jgi:hypothetical protein
VQIGQRCGIWPGGKSFAVDPASQSVCQKQRAYNAGKSMGAVIQATLRESHASDSPRALAQSLLLTCFRTCPSCARCHLHPRRSAWDNNLPTGKLSVIDNSARLPGAKPDSAYTQKIPCPGRADSLSYAHGYRTTCMNRSSL